MKSNAKFDPIAVIIIAIIPISMFLFGYLREGISLNTFLITGVVLLFVSFSTLGSYYKLEEHALIIKVNGVKREVEYSDIKGIRKGTSKVLFMTSFSTKGIIVETNSNGTFLISPKDLDTFYSEFISKL